MVLQHTWGLCSYVAQMERVWESKALAFPALTATLFIEGPFCIVQSSALVSGQFYEEDNTHSFVCFHLNPTPLALNRHGEWMISALCSCSYFAKSRMAKDSSSSLLFAGLQTQALLPTPSAVSRAESRLGGAWSWLELPRQEWGVQKADRWDSAHAWIGIYLICIENVGESHRLHHPPPPPRPRNPSARPGLGGF